ncbi:MAG: hypothetical protein ACRERR_08075 [Moraxellaceae bacterium]
MRFLKNEYFLLFFLSVLVSASPARALEWSAGLGGDAYWFDWREYRDGEQLLVESGPMALGRADLRLQGDAFYSSLAFGWGGGKAHYDGQLQNGTPYESDAWEEVMETELQLGSQQSWGNMHAGLIQRDWDRQINGSGTVSSVHEVYRWRLLTVGTELALLTTPNGSTSLAIDIGLPIDSHQKVYSGEFGNFNLEPGNGHYWRLMLKWQQAAWELSPFLQQQTMDVSNSLQLRARDGTLYSITQPESGRIEGGLRLRYVFGAGAQNRATTPATSAEPSSQP